MERLIRRSRAAGWSWVGLGLLGLVVLASACSDDSSSPNGSLGGSGGASGGGASGRSTGGTTHGGMPNAAGTSTGTGGSDSTPGGAPPSMSGGAAGAELMPEGGMAGMPTAPPVLSLGTQCSTCGASQCTDTLKSCNDSAECTAWLACLTACDSGACTNTCDSLHVDAARLYAGVYDCMCTSCSDTCGGANACDKKTCVDDNTLIATQTAPPNLAETGLYTTLDGSGGDGSGGAAGGPGVELAMPVAIASYVRTYEPKYPLWADGATKQRYIYIPKCSTIDTSDMDHWKFPVGTRFWKQFTVDGKVVETRFLHRFGSGALDWVYAAYQWDVTKPDDPSAAKWANDLAVPNANGTTHDIPSGPQCKQCHNGLPEKVLGFGAFQLSHDSSGSDLTIKTISELGWLTTPAPDGFTVPGNAVQQAALGYMHGNCGGCHNDSTPTPASVPQILRLSVAKKDYATTDTVTTTVGIAVVSGNVAITGKHRIEPMDPANSAILIRMSNRTPPGLQMPPLATKVVDTAGGVQAVTDWVNSIPTN